MKKLSPLIVPWMISPSMPNLKMMLEDNGRGVFQFFGFFGFEPLTEDERTKQDIGQGTQGLRLDPSRKNGRHQLISLTFKNIGWLIKNPQHSDTEVINESLFDWSEVRGRLIPGETISEWQNRCSQEWVNTKISPNPSIYTITNSDWNIQEAKTWELKHYLILGDSSYIEILAQDFEWISEGTVLGW